jgi:malic enzyme
VCLGGGSAGLGVINSLIDGMVEEGLPREVHAINPAFNLNSARD